MKAMGIESDQEAASLVGPEADFGALFLPSLEAAAEAGVVTQQQALQWLGARPEARDGMQGRDRPRCRPVQRVTPLPIFNIAMQISYSA